VLAGIRDRASTFALGFVTHHDATVLEQLGLTESMINESESHDKRVGVRTNLVCIGKAATLSYNFPSFTDQMGVLPMEHALMLLGPS